jgi:hypothetical protein
MSDTPRTDEQEHFIDSDRGIVDSGLARELERELNAANERIKLLKITGDELLEWLKDGTISDSNYRLLANAWQRAKENKR